MTNIAKFPMVAGVEITTDEEGRFNLNALRQASEHGKRKAPNYWLGTKQAQELIKEMEFQTRNSGLAQNMVTQQRPKPEFWLRLWRDQCS